MILILSLTGLALNAQTKGFDGADAVSTHAISAQIFGLDYGYEQRLGGDFSMVFRAGIVTYENSIYSSPDGLRVDYTSTFGVNIEPRYYTNFNRRTRLGKTTYKNSGDFVSMRIEAGFPDGLQMRVTPMYGIRRVWGKHWFGEFTSGLTLNLGAYDSAGIHLQYRVGFVF